MILDLFRLSLRNIRHRGLRSWLTVIGILIGTAAVVALISIGQGLQRAISSRVEQIVGYNTILITSRGLNLGQRIRLDIEAIRAIPGVRNAVAVRTETAYVEGPGGKGFLAVLGYDPAMDEFVAEMNLTVSAGRALAGRGEVLLGSRTARALGAQVGDEVTIEGRKFQVVGILQALRAGGFATGGLSMADLLVIPLPELRELFPGPELVQYAVVRLSERADMAAVSERIRDHLRAVGERNASLTDFEDLTRNIQSVISGVQAFLAGIAGIALLVGGVGVMNTMYTAVLERTREIGILKAVGAKDTHVLLLFLFESGLMGLGGGALGLLIGFGVAWAATAIVSRVFQAQGAFSPVLSMALVLGALFFSFLVGAIAGIFPAYRAARLPPVDALRYE
ncbi:MAG: ABC transporter permease [Candidatus Bipolaricaulota bacterium]|nr:ABC transporter permease [Candidatus Bipolaricaulota bacterium]MDW8126431.1 ABC transporter permease [Candidatus Bipolaricaulota bacterium]